jgi:hypothetical protein
VNGELIKQCSKTDSIGTHTQPFTIGEGYYNKFDGIIDDVGIWNTALSATNIHGLYWSGDGSYYPIVNASDGGYSFKITADDVVLKKFETQYTGDASGTEGDAGVFVRDAEDVQLDKIKSYYNTVAIRLKWAPGTKIYSSGIDCDSEHEFGLFIYESDNIEVAWGNYDCATEAGIYSLSSKGGVYRDLNLDSNHRGIFFFANTGVPNSASSNYINDTNIYNSTVKIYCRISAVINIRIIYIIR